MTDLPPYRAQLLDPAACFATLTALLWSEREALERVLFKVVTERLIVDGAGGADPMSGGRTLRWLAKADDELAAALRTMADRSAERTEAVTELALVLGMDGPCRLVDIARVAPEPWPAILTDHRTALRVLVRDLATAVATTRRRLRVSGDAVRESLDELVEERTTQQARSLRAALDQFRAIDRELAVSATDAAHRNALRTVSSVVDRALLDFLA